MKTKYVVKRFVFNVVDGYQIRNVEVVGENLTWQDAKKLRNEHKGSWIV